MRKNNAFLIIVLTILIALRCQRMAKSEPVSLFDKTQIMFVNNKEYLQLQWDNLQNTDTSDIDGYKVYYSVYDTDNWKPIEKEIEVSNSPFVNINRSELDSNDSVFIFAVKVYLRNGHTSELRTSIDSLALPYGGWFVKWNNYSEAK